MSGLEDKLSGILIISTKEVKNGLFIGMIAPVRSEKSQEDITTSEENQII